MAERESVTKRNWLPGIYRVLVKGVASTPSLLLWQVNITSIQSGIITLQFEHSEGCIPGITPATKSFGDTDDSESVKNIKSTVNLSLTVAHMYAAQEERLSFSRRIQEIADEI